MEAVTRSFRCRDGHLRAGFVLTALRVHRHRSAALRYQRQVVEDGIRRGVGRVARCIRNTIRRSVGDTIRRGVRDTVRRSVRSTLQQEAVLV